MLGFGHISIPYALVRLVMMALETLFTWALWLSWHVLSFSLDRMRTNTQAVCFPEQAKNNGYRRVQMIYPLGDCTPKQLQEFKEIIMDIQYFRGEI